MASQAATLKNKKGTREHPAKTGTVTEAVTKAVPAMQSPTLPAVKPQFKKYVEQFKAMSQNAEAIVIHDEDSLKAAVALGGEAKKIAKLIEAKKKEVTADAGEFVKAVNNFCKIFTDRLTGIEQGLKKKISTYQAGVELERRKQEEIAKKAAGAMQKQINRDARKAGIEPPSVPAPVIPRHDAVTRAETGTSAFQVKRWVCTIVDAAMVPREFCEPSQKLLNDAVRHGLREIPGCLIEETSETRFRT